MRDLLVVTPTRGRPDRVRLLANAISRTATHQTDLILGLDDDDDTAEGVMEHLQVYPNVKFMRGPRAGLGPWTNTMVAAELGNYKAYASFGDDHVPRTLGWDAECLQQLEEMGGGLVAPNGILSPGFPEQVVISAPIVEALEWMCLPGLQHWYVDQVWYDFGRMTGRYRWLDRVMVEHRQDPTDETGIASAGSMDLDREVYARWLLDEAPADFETVRKAVGA